MSFRTLRIKSKHTEQEIVDLLKSAVHSTFQFSGIGEEYTVRITVKPVGAKKQSGIKITNLDKLATQAIRKREKNICQRCLHKVSGSNSQCAHIRPRSYKQTRWYLPNLLHLCLSCHKWAHSDPIEFTQWVKKLIGFPQYNQLCIISNETWDRDELKWETYLKSELHLI